MSAALDAAMHTVWLHGDWFWLTRSMTTEEKEAAAAAVRRHDVGTGEPGGPIDDRELRWWEPQYRYTPAGVDTWRIAVGARVEAERVDYGRWVGEVRRRGAQTVQLSHCHRTGCTRTATFTFDQILRVVSSPVDVALARLDAADPEQKEARHGRRHHFDRYRQLDR